MIVVCTSICLPSSQFPLYCTEKSIWQKVRNQHNRTFWNRQNFLIMMHYRFLRAAALRGLVVLDSHAYCLISIVIIPPPHWSAKVVELLCETVHPSIALVGWIQTTNHPLTFNDQLVPLKTDVPCITSSTVCVCFLRHRIMSSNPGHWYVSLLLYSHKNKPCQW